MVFFVMEYCPGGELFYHIRNKHKFKEESVLFYITELALALNHLHTKNIIYRDIKVIVFYDKKKPENIMLDIDGHVK